MMCTICTSTHSFSCSDVHSVICRLPQRMYLLSYVRVHRNGRFYETTRKFGRWQWCQNVLERMRETFLESLNRRGLTFYRSVGGRRGRVG
jgi:hypothetical protein